MAKNKEQLPGAENPGNQTSPKEGERVEAKSAFKLSGMFFEKTGKPGINEAIGNEIELIDDYDSTQPYNNDIRVILPGVAAVYWLGVFGIANTLGDPINIAVQKMYLKLQEVMKNRTLPFEGVDMMKVVLASDQTAVGYSLIVRAVQTLGVSSISNRYLPATLMDAMGWDYQDFLDNLADIKESLKIWKELIDNYMYVPDVFPMFRAHQQMSTMIYTDGQGQKAQAYVCMPTHLWSWGSNDTTWSMSAVKITNAADVNGALMTWANVKEAMNSLILTTLGSTDFQRISAAVKTTYTELGVKPVQLTGPDDIGPLVFMYDEDFLNTLANADVEEVTDAQVATWAPHDNGANTIICGGTTNVSQSYERRTVLFNTTRDEPEAAEMVNFSRWKISHTGAANAINSVGTEIITQVRILGPTYRTVEEGSIVTKHEPLFVGRSGGQGEFNRITLSDFRFHSTVTNPSYEALSAADAFSGFPMFYVYDGPVDDDGTESTRYLAPIIHWNFMAKMSNSDLRAYHRAMIYASFLE